jgi:hypothetical protein
MADDLAALKQTVFGEQGSDAETIKQKEEAISKLSDAYVKQQDAKALTELLSQLRPFFAVIPKTKTAKLVRNIIDQIAKIPNSTDIQVRGTWGCQPCSTHLQSACSGARAQASPSQQLHCCCAQQES